MYESIKGQLIDKTPSRAVVEAGGIGYRLTIPLSTYARLPALEKPVQLFLSQVVREDSNTLYAFLAKEERDLFETLIATVSGVGPKAALAIVGHMELGAFQRAVATANIQLLSKIPGIGKKSAERLVIDMRDKCKGKQDLGTPVSGADGILGDAMNALIHLGYNPLNAQKAVHAALAEKKGEADLGKIITAALQKI